MSAWRSPEEILELGFSRSRVVMCNEAHSGLKRCVRTREIGRRLLPVAHACGCRHLALEALGGPYVEQPDLKALIDDALALGFELIPYETRDTRSPFLADGGVDLALVNARERDQAESLAAALPETPLLVWCGNSHHAKHASGGGWVPMGLRFRELTGIDYFAIDQAVTVFASPELLEPLRGDLEQFGGTAGLLREDVPPPFCGRADDALVFSLENELV